jgi:hypothetical protein
MENNLSLGAWVVIGLVALIFITLNLSLLNAWMKKDHGQQPGIWQDLSQSLGKRWKQDEDQLRELRWRTKRLRDAQIQDQDDRDE